MQLSFQSASASKQCQRQPYSALSLLTTRGTASLFKIQPILVVLLLTPEGRVRVVLLSLLRILDVRPTSLGPHQKLSSSACRKD